MDLPQLIVGTLGGAVAVTAAFWAWSGKLVEHFLSKTLKQQEAAWKSAADSQLEALKADLARGTAVATARVEHLRSLWEATHRYGGAIGMLAHGRGDPDEANQRIDEFNSAISRAGVFIGHERYETLLSRIGGPFIQKLVAVRDSPEEKQRLFDEFQHVLWPTTLGEIEDMLSAAPRT